MPEDCTFLLSFELGGGGGSGCWCKSGRGLVVIPFRAIENEGLHKILQSFLKGRVFFCIPGQFPSCKKETTKEESITCQILVYFYQNNGIPNQHNMVLAVLSPLKNKLVLLSITQ